MAAGLDRLQVQEPCATLPTFQLTVPETNQAPVEDGGFLNVADSFIRPTIVAERDYELPNYQTRPIDLATGLPYCFVPNPDLPPVMWPQPNIERIADWDHQYPRVETRYGNNPVLLRYGANLALMNLRIQWTMFDEHHEVWNNSAFIGPMQPGNAKQLAATMLFGISGYIPPIGLNLQSGTPVEQKLTDDERRFLWESKQVRIACESPVLSYLRAYVLSQEVDHIQDRQVDEFLHTFDLERRVYLGHCLAAKVIERAVEPFDQAYTAAHKRGLLSIRDDTSGALGPAPPNPRDLLKSKLTRGRRFGPVMDALLQRLASYRKSLDISTELIVD